VPEQQGSICLTGMVGSLVRRWPEDAIVLGGTQPSFEGRSALYHQRGCGRMMCRVQRCIPAGAQLGRLRCVSLFCQVSAKKSHRECIRLQESLQAMSQIMRILNFFAGISGLLLATVFPLRLRNASVLFYDLTYSHYYRRFLGRCGANFFLRAPLHVIGPQYISIGNNFYAGRRLRIEAISGCRGGQCDPRIHIGDNVGFNYDCHIGCINRVTIGNNVLLASRVFITDHFHGDMSPESLLIGPRDRVLYCKGPVVIEDNVWIGEGVAVMPNVTIGRDSIIGANSVVTKDIPANSLAAGVPARVIRALGSLDNERPACGSRSNP
jgi:acetyltransferase-like isoleucine patch superfamily enzyme